MNKILITGASGYLGSHLCKFLAKTNHKIFGLHNTSEIPTTGIEKVKVDLVNYSDLNYLFKDIKPDFVVHLSAITPAIISTVDEKYVREINVELTKQISINSKTYNSFIIFASSDLVYKDGENLTEESELEPLTLYAQTKLAAEKIVSEKAKYYLILRFSLMYGFSISTHKTFFDHSFLQLYQNQPVSAFQDQYRNALFVEDSANFISKLFEIKLKYHDIMNLCGWELLSRYEMVYRVAKTFGLNSDLIVKISCDDFYEYKVPKYLNLNFDKMKEYNFIPRKYDEAINYLKDNFDDYKQYIFQVNRRST